MSGIVVVFGGVVPGIGAATGDGVARGNIGVIGVVGGLGIGVALGHPLYVVEKNADTNRITVGTKRSLQSIGCLAAEANWHEPSSRDFRPCTAKIRYNAAPVAARVRERSDGLLEVRFDDVQESVAPGQAVVCYEDDMVICGGWIKQAIED